ncbi:uncharacterized protein LOC122379127 [Amphibalanus amphitrite]|uniref:uncharacterized protein LOC122379127 n=1 Tax=Amphibalanus amphitrite TaxID=1232801 RepID=UPI001C92AC85|nr:uncharacterized protein LOC122379127 [Amphibalanus amphitrite]
MKVILGLLRQQDPRGLLCRPYSSAAPGAVGGQGVTQETPQTDLRIERDDDNKSAASRKSTASSFRAKLLETRLQDERQRAEAEAKMAALQSRRKLDQMRQELEWKEEELRLKTQIEVSAAQREAANRIAEEEEEMFVMETGARPRMCVEHQQAPAAMHEAATLRNYQETEGPTIDTAGLGISRSTRVPLDAVGDPQGNAEMTSQEQLLTGLSTLLSAQNKRSDLPKLEPDVFKGNVEDFPLWLKSFESFIESKTESPVERLNYMSRYTAGEARSAIHGLLCLRTNDAYDRAKARLIERYGNSFITVTSYKKRLRDWPVIKPGDTKALQQLADFLDGCSATADVVPGMRTLGEAEENAMILKKLPRYIVDKWKRIVDKKIYEPEPGQEPCYPSFDEFVTFLAREARIASGPVAMLATQEETRSQRRPQTQPANGRVRTFLSSAGAPRPATELRSGHTGGSLDPTPIKCLLCPGRHITGLCDVFRSSSLDERHELVKRYRLCRGCLRAGHRWRECRRKETCDRCGKRHPTLLHDERLASVHRETQEKRSVHDGSTQTATSLQVTAERGTTPCSHSMIVPVRIWHRLHPELNLVTYAVLDSQSDACFLKSSVRDSLQADGEPIQLELSTMAGKSRLESLAVKDLVIESLSTGTEIELPTTYTRDDILLDRQLIPRKSTVQAWEHLTEVASSLPRYYEEADIGLLLGLNCGAAIKPLQTVTGGDNEPWAVRTELGWSVVGTVETPTTPSSGCYLVNVGSDVTIRRHFAFRMQVREVTPEQVSHLFDSDFKEVSKGAKMSQEDMRFETLMKEQMVQGEDGHFVAPLPLKDPDSQFPNNRIMAEQRLASLRRRLLSQPRLKEEYQAYMQDMLDKGYAEAVPDDERCRDDGKVWYVAHHGVYSQTKQKLRVVFDCSGEFQGCSLNNQLMQGPDVSNNLCGILTRFRKERIGITCDVKGMFNQVRVAPEDRDLIRFLWWENGDMRREPSEYRMTTHLFGASSSPACAMSALNKTADQYEEVFGSDAADFIRRDFYVDDGLTSTTEEKSSVQLVKDTISMCSSGGFELHKFTSNCPEVVASVPESRRAKSLEHVDISERTVIEHALGMKWNLQEDSFHINTDISVKPTTRRGILSMVSSLYDPLGWVAPFTLLGKNIVKQLCCDGRDWDEPVPDHVEPPWEEWKTDLKQIADISIPRRYAFSEHSLADCRCELHHFSDASLDGYGACSYLRIIDQDGSVTTSLVMSKSRVTPKKSVTIPRLELAAAVVAVRTSVFLRSELCLPNLTEHFWTDSLAVLGYVQNESKRFHVYVANRVQEIRQFSSARQWRYVQSADNPADLVSRGMRADSLKTSTLWWEGPSFLKQPGSLPGGEIIVEVPADDREVKAAAFQSGTSTGQLPKSYGTMSSRLSYFSSWYRAKRSVALCLRYRTLLLERIRSKSGGKSEKCSPSGPRRESDPVSVKEMQEAEKVILRAVQEECFVKEMKTDATKMTSGVTADGTSSLKRLNPFVADDGLLRAGGRLRRSSLPFEVIHPVILPKEGQVTKLIVYNAHEELHHAGRESTLSEIRHRGYWILHGRSVVSKCILGCIQCRRIRGSPCGQKMADLPTERTEMSEPFEFCGVDAFGPFFVREKRSEVKRWGLMFTCFASRAAHLEVISSLTADSFINAYRRFICRRGPIRRIYCDNGTNFIGGKNLLESALKEEDHKRIAQTLSKDNCDWVEFAFNVPYASHMGGVWERQIRTARTALTSLLSANGQQLDDELLQTLFAEAEAIINSRPLTYCSMSSSDTVEPLTPLQLLTLKSKVVLPAPGMFCSADLYGRRRWRRVQHLATEFWTRWRREFLPSLQERRKWQRPEHNLQEDDVVIMVDDSQPRGAWPLGLVVATYPATDGLVRRVRVRVNGQEYDRPVHRLISLMRRGQCDSQSGSQ